MVPCERKADLDEFEPGLEFVRSRVNGVLVAGCQCHVHQNGNWCVAHEKLHEFGHQ